jgi:hypothetical protein
LNNSAYFENETSLALSFQAKETLSLPSMPVPLVNQSKKFED